MAGIRSRCLSFIVTHHPEDALEDAGFTFIDGLDEAITQARDAAGGKDVFVMGGADVIRQALRAGYVEEPSFRWPRSCSVAGSTSSTGSTRR